MARHERSWDKSPDASESWVLLQPQLWVLPPNEIYKQINYNEGGNKRKLATELKLSAQKNKPGVTAATAIPYENIPFVSLLKYTNKV